MINSTTVCALKQDTLIVVLKQQQYTAHLSDGSRCRRGFSETPTGQLGALYTECATCLFHRHTGKLFSRFTVWKCMQPAKYISNCSTGLLFTTPCQPVSSPSCVYWYVSCQTYLKECNSLSCGIGDCGIVWEFSAVSVQTISTTQIRILTVKFVSLKQGLPWNLSCSRRAEHVV